MSQSDSPSLSETAAIAPAPWVVWSNDAQLWWGANRGGYTSNLLGAGIYTEEEAKHIAATTHHRCGYSKMVGPAERALSLADALEEFCAPFAQRSGTFVIQLVRSSLSSPSLTEASDSGTTTPSLARIALGDVGCPYCGATGAALYVPGDGDVEIDSEGLVAGCRSCRRQFPASSASDSGTTKSGPSETKNA